MSMYMYKAKKVVPVLCGSQVWVSRPHWRVVRAQLRGRNRNRPAAGQDQSYLYITSTPAHQHQHNSTQKRPTASQPPLSPTFLRFGESFARPFLNMHTLQKAVAPVRPGSRNMQPEVWCMLIMQICKQNHVDNHMQKRLK